MLMAILQTLNLQMVYLMHLQSLVKQRQVSGYQNNTAVHMVLAVFIWSLLETLTIPAAMATTGLPTTSAVMTICLIARLIISVL